MDLRADRLFARHDLEDSIAHVGRMRRSEPDPRDAGYAGRGAQQLGEIGFVMAVRVDGLAEKHDFAKSHPSGFAHLIENES
jgi:hypothetical protein